MQNLRKLALLCLQQLYHFQQILKAVSFFFLNLVIVFCDPRSFLKYLLSDNAEVDINPKDELVFLKGSKGLMAAISITNRTSSLIAFKIKTTSPGIIHFEKSHYKYQYTIHYIVKKIFLSFFLQNDIESGLVLAFQQLMV